VPVNAHLEVHVRPVRTARHPDVRDQRTGRHRHARFDAGGEVLQVGIARDQPVRVPDVDDAAIALQS